MSKRFSLKVMDYKLEAKVSKGMYLFVIDQMNTKDESVANYIRTLIMKDLNIDEFGNPVKKKANG